MINLNTHIKISEVVLTNAQFTYLCTGSWRDDFNNFWRLVVDRRGVRLGRGRRERRREREYRYYVH